MGGGAAIFSFKRELNAKAPRAPRKSSKKGQRKSSLGVSALVILGPWRSFSLLSYEIACCPACRPNMGETPMPLGAGTRNEGATCRGTQGGPPPASGKSEGAIFLWQFETGGIEFSQASG